MSATTPEASVNATDAVVDFVQAALPPASAVSDAGAALGTFRGAAHKGIESSVVMALRGCLSQPGTSADDAWLLGTAAAAAGAAPRWVAVCAAVVALESDDSRRTQIEDVALRATAVGFAVADAVAAAVGSSHEAEGWSVSATAGLIGAVSAAGSALSLDAERLRHAIGIAATQAAGLKWVQGTDADALQLGKAASNAVEAALMASNGFTAAADSLSGRRGMFALMSTDAEPALVVHSLARAWL